MQRDYKLKEIIEKIKESGIPCSRPTIDYWQKTGKLTLRKRAYSNWRVANDDEISQIIHEFREGKGEWHYQSGKHLYQTGVDGSTGSGT